MTYAISIDDNKCLNCRHQWTSSLILQRTNTGYSYVANHRANTRELLENPDLLTCQITRDTPLLHPRCVRCIDPVLLKVGWPRDESVLRPRSNSPTPAKGRGKATPPTISLADILKDI